MKVNLQTPVKAERRDDGSLLVHSIFLTIQGEGPHVGEPAVFVRLAGCNLQCPGCDTEYTENARRKSFHELTDAIQAIHRLQCIAKPLIVITGGEPFRQNLIPFFNWLAKHKYRFQVETNGTLGLDKYALSDDARFGLEVVCSPKTGKVVESLHEFIIAYKYVVDADNVAIDGLPESVLGLPAKPARPHAGYHKKIYLQPADELDPVLNQKNLDAAIHACTEHGYTLCLQTHKFIGLA